MNPALESWYRIEDFLNSGGPVLLLIAAVLFVMWTLILERFWYMRVMHPREVARVLEIWRSRSETRSWYAHQIRTQLISEVRMKLESSLGVIRTLVAVCPLLGLLGTVTGMIEVFDVMAITGSSNTRAMSSGVTRATIPTMAGMVAALSGLYLSVTLSRRAKAEVQRTADQLVQR